MLFDFEALQQTIEDWPDAFGKYEECNEFSEPVLGRIYQIFSYAYETNNSLAYPDLLPLLRQFLFKREASGGSPELRFPKSIYWPDEQTWECYGFKLDNLTSYDLVSPCPWHPSWNDSREEEFDVFYDTYAETKVRLDNKVKTDPFLGDVSGYEYYTGTGQRDAVKNMLSMPPGSTLTVNLPTGAGKSLLAQIPILLNGLNNGLTIVVVPTISLAIDQSRRIKELLSGVTSSSSASQFAWHSGLDESDKQEIKNNIRSGLQGILFTSPEAIVGALLPSLYEAAGLGLINYFIIDEAHLLAQWGDTFRPSFQALSGIRKGLLKACCGEPFRTILMSATFTPVTIETLDVLFSPNQMISAGHLRPEPCYFVKKVEFENDKHRCVLDLLKHCPRPFIIYTTKVESANALYRVLKEESGISRVALFTGKTNNSDRSQIIDHWVNDRIDGIVATSAFGVGMDKGDVKTVIHATVPETLDRFYQEVGRSGRDGKASISYTIYSDTDIQIAKDLNRQRNISTEKAFERWQNLFTHKIEIPNEELFLVNLDSTPGHLRQQTPYNNDWNMRTLIVMSRAGLIELDSLPPEKTAEYQNEKEQEVNELEIDWDNYFKTVVVNTINPNHLNKDIFEAALSRLNQKTIQANKISLDRLINVLSGKAEIGKTLCEMYNSRLPDKSYFVAHACRGCPNDGYKKGYIPIYATPRMIGINDVQDFNTNDWNKMFPVLDQGGTIFYDPKKNSKRELIMALQVVISRYDVPEVVVNDEHIPFEDLAKIHHFSRRKVVFISAMSEQLHQDYSPPIPRVSVIPPWIKKGIPESFLLMSNRFHIVFAPNDIAGEYAHKRLIDIDLDAIHFDDFMRTATQ